MIIDRPKVAEGGEADLKEELPLGEGVLTVNLGLPLIVLCTKSDLIQSNEKGLFNDHSLEAFRRSIRTSALLCIS